ncbi:uncharacterized protein LOC124143708 isoform X1 [Haliotis rufescens]|uniref:uncharacterized protein LOC124143708 isoform X1 n=1 Tax=Haliotis rufescens TaxID=6454 RepID=UPI00201F08FF|nr:uncharacterized protein LOC124143708 isoform X1 [Haliotis rufescens]
MLMMHIRKMLMERTRTNMDVSITYDRGSKLRKSSTMIAFVRNPYTRLFSGYVDKMYCINPSFWKSVGKSVLRVVRGNASRTGSVRCGHDISFAEFVNYFIYQHDNKQHIDSHFMPISEHCKFCETEYTYIGKIETFRDDMLSVSDAMGMLDYKTTREAILKYGFHGKRETISCWVSLVYDRRVEIETCGLSFIEGLRALWKTCQIRGMISKEIPFPLQANDTKITFERFNELAQKAYNASEPSILHEGRNRALRQAYGSLTYHAKVKLRKIFERDFEMFDYDPMPDFVFGEYQNVDNIDFFS